MKTKILKNLPLVLNQKYEDFEVIVVNDRSWDNSIETINKFKAQYSKLKIVDIPDNNIDNLEKTCNYYWDKGGQKQLFIVYRCGLSTIVRILD